MRPDVGKNSQISPSISVRTTRSAGGRPNLDSVLLARRRERRENSRQMGSHLGNPDLNGDGPMAKVGRTARRIIKINANSENDGNPLGTMEEGGQSNETRV